MTLGAAYGRQYKTAKEIKEDWDNNKDFVILDVFHGGGTYVNKADAPAGIHTVRYARNTKVAAVKK